MIDLRKHKDFIKEQVAKLSKRDPHWKWLVKSVSKKKVCIKWGYLTEYDNKDSCFTMVANEDESEGYGWLCCKNHEGKTIDGCFTSGELETECKNTMTDTPIDRAIVQVLEWLYDYAKDRY